MSQLLDKPEQSKLLPDRRPMIQIAERSPLQQSQNINQSTARSNVLMLKSSIVAKCSGHHDKVIPVSDYTIPQTLSECDSISRTIRGKGMQDIRGEIPAYADPIYRPPPKPTEIPLQVIPRKPVDSDTDDLEQDINMAFVENFPYQEGVISEMYQRPDRSYFQEPPEL